MPEGHRGAEAREPGTGMQGGAHPCAAPPCSQVVTEGKEEAVVATLPGPRG